jgi:hypothetical protein
MSDRYYNPFQGLHLNMPVSYRDDFSRYCQTGERNILDQSPFPRMVDFWFLALCIAVNKGLDPVDLSKFGNKDTYKIIDASIFTSDPWRIQAMMLLAIAKEGEIGIISQPSKMMALVNGLAVAGLPSVIEMLKDGDDDAIWNLSENIEAAIKE